MTTTLSIRLPKSLRERLAETARRSGVSQGSLVCEGLEMRLGANTRQHGILRLAGVMKGPRDLSYNKAYRRQWGKRTR